MSDTKGAKKPAEKPAKAEKSAAVPTRRTQKTYSATASDALASRAWWVVDATDKPLGRLASEVARVLRGKHKPTFTTNIDTGDFVVVVNAAKVKLTGRKLDQKKWQRHSGIPGGFKADTYRDLLESKPTFPVEKAVRGMLPKSVLGREMFTKLKVYATPDHPHAAQKPQPLAF